METLKPHSAGLRLLFFWIGILATIAYRSIIVLNNIGTVWVQVVWYFGTVGFVLYFLHRYQVAKKRARVIAEYKLAERIQSLDNLSEEERSAMRYIFTTLGSSKERWNYIVIFTSSTLAILIGIYLDFLS
ncbi:MAG: hypothetical protein H6760_00450 [Candidatus Nomurabacteria bacterium]|nr:MAG: hypothetical protein H6760_00450 [Candidatus Nomurabacteria bacterium]